MANKIEVLKQAKDGLDVFPDLLRYAREGHAAIAPDDFERLKWYGLFHRKATPGYFMLRLRMPNGILTSEQMAAIGEIAIAAGGVKRISPPGRTSSCAGSRSRTFPGSSSVCPLPVSPRSRAVWTTFATWLAAPLRASIPTS